MYIANCPFNKIKILSEATTGLEKSFGMMFSNLCLNSRETVPLREECVDIFHNMYVVFLLLEGDETFGNTGSSTASASGDSPITLFYAEQLKGLCYLRGRF